MRFMRPCLDCGTLTHGSRCRTHQGIITAQRNARRDSDPVRQERKKSLYNHEYRKAAKAIRANASHCHLCNQPIWEGQPVDVDHLEPGNPDSALLPAHARCNRSRGNKPI